MNTRDIELFQKTKDYPYMSSKTRETTILENMNQLERGMTKDDVIELMTLPDEVNLTYAFKHVKPNQVIGFSMVYLLRRYLETGSAHEKKEQLLRIHFDDFEKLIWAYSVDIDSFNPIEKDAGYSAF